MPTLQPKEPLLLLNLCPEICIYCDDIVEFPNCLKLVPEITEARILALF